MCFFKFKQIAFNARLMRYYLKTHAHTHIHLFIDIAIVVMSIKIVTTCMRQYDIWFLSVILFHICNFFFHFGMAHRPQPSSPLTAFTQEFISSICRAFTQLCTHAHILILTHTVYYTQYTVYTVICHCVWVCAYMLLLPLSPSHFYISFYLCAIVKRNQSTIAYIWPQ